MARFTPAYSSLAVRLTEVDILRRSAARIERRDPISRRHEINALCRGAIVLLSAHLEAFVKELGEVALEALHVKAVERAPLSSRLYYHISKDALQEIRDTEDHEKIADKVFDFIQNDLKYWSKTGPFPNQIDSNRFSAGFSNPAYSKICAYIGRFGYKQFKSDLSADLRANYQPTVNMIDHLVDTRNKIAHGDISVTKTPAELVAMMRFTQDFCKATDRMFATWCRSNICAIR